MRPVIHESTEIQGIFSTCPFPPEMILRIMDFNRISCLFDENIISLL